MLTAIAVAATIAGQAAAMPSNAGSTIPATTACTSGAPAIAFAPNSEIQVPVGSGSAVPPPIQISCGESTVANPEVTVNLTAGTAQVFLATRYPELYDATDPAGASSFKMTGDTEGVVTLPIISSTLTDGSFTLEATFDGASASLQGQVTGTLQGILPPNNPQQALATEQLQWPTCQGIEDQSSTCLNTSVAVLNAGRMNEQLGPLLLPSNWRELTIPQQLFVLTDLERTARGLPPLSGLAADWDTLAQEGANAGRDPVGFEPWSEYRSSSDPQIDQQTGGGFDSVEDPGSDNAVQAMTAWVYTDGIYPDGASGDADCSAADPQNCWGHRDAILNDSGANACQLECVAGAADSPTGYQGTSPSFTEIFPVYGGNDADPLVFAWSSELPSLPSCEQQADTCSWIGQPLPEHISNATSTYGSPTETSTTSKPLHELVVVLGRIHRRRRRISIEVRLKSGIATIAANARSGHRHVKLRVLQRSGRVFSVQGTLPPGRWTITVRLHPARGWANHSSIQRSVTIR